MTLFSLGSVLVVLAALCSYLNYRCLRLPPTIGVMVTVLVASLLLLAAGSTATRIRASAAALVGQIDFNEAVLHGMLAFLLFAGALQLDLGDMAREKWTIGLLAVLGNCISTFLVGLSAWGILSFIGLQPGLMPCLLFGALISPTDPIAVLAIMQKVGAPKRLEIQITGESLFNDGVGVVVFLTLLELSKPHAMLGVADVSVLLIREVGGGILLGLAAGLLTYYLLRRSMNTRLKSCLHWRWRWVVMRWQIPFISQRQSRQSSRDYSSETAGGHLPCLSRRENTSICFGN